MKILFYSAKDFELEYLRHSNKRSFSVEFTENSLSADTVSYARGFDCVSVFTGDDVSSPVIEELYRSGVRFIAVRAAGYDNIDLKKAKEKNIIVANVPDYSPYAIAEHAMALILALNRNLILSDRQVHCYNFKMNNLIGFDLHGKTAGVIGAGKIGAIMVKILHGFGCKVLAYDIKQNEQLIRDYQVRYTDLNMLCRESDIISIHTCLNEQTKYIINAENIKLMKKGVMLINTSRGACVNTADVLHYLGNSHIGYFGTDVYEKERGIFFYDYSTKLLQDEMLKKLIAMPNVMVTPHQGFATTEAIANIAETTFYNIACWADNLNSENELFRLDTVTAAAHRSAR